MSDHDFSQVSISLQTGHEGATLIDNAIKDQSESSSRVMKPKSLSGEAPTYLLLATLAVKELPTILKRLAELADSLPIRRAEIDGVKYEKLSGKEFKRIMDERAKTRAKSGKKNARNPN
jgi:hypothetical protein